MLICQTSAANTIKLVEAVPGVSFVQPVLMRQPVVGGALYVAEQTGRIIAVDPETGARSVFADIHKRVHSGGEKGLLGFDFSPDFPVTPEIYLSYTARNGSQLMSRVSRFSIDKKGRFDATSEQILLTVKQPWGNHNGGHIRFGPDGMLYIGFGDGGSAGDPGNNGLNPATWLGSLLRIDVHQQPRYRIPADNPFPSSSEIQPETWAWGLRNPWRWSFDRKTGQLWLADVGQNAWEEVNLIQRGGNYGWNGREARHCYKISRCRSKQYIDPVHEYSHDQGQSITGGHVYRGERYPDWQGRYFFADFVFGKIWSLDTADVATSQPGTSPKVRLEWQGKRNFSSFAEDAQGELYILDYMQGSLLRLSQ